MALPNELTAVPNVHTPSAVVREPVLPRASVEPSGESAAGAGDVVLTVTVSPEVIEVGEAERVAVGAVEGVDGGEDEEGHAKLVILLCLLGKLVIGSGCTHVQYVAPLSPEKRAGFDAVPPALATSALQEKRPETNPVPTLVNLQPMGHDVRKPISTNTRYPVAPETRSQLKRAVFESALHDAVASKDPSVGTTPT